MKTASLGVAYQEAIAASGAAGGVVRWFGYLAEGRAGEAVHRAASLAAMGELRRDYDRPGAPLTLDEARMRSWPITIEELVGAVEVDEEVLTSPGAYLDLRQRRFAEGRGFSHGLERRYLRAFVDPPYGLRLPPARADEVFAAINEPLFGGFRDDLDIRRWSDDWSSFFDPGREWWGALWWSVHNRTRDLAIVVAASSTD